MDKEHYIEELKTLHKSAQRDDNLALVAIFSATIGALHSNSEVELALAVQPFIGNMVK